MSDAYARRIVGDSRNPDWHADCFVSEFYFLGLIRATLPFRVSLGLCILDVIVRFPGKVGVAAGLDKLLRRVQVRCAPHRKPAAQNCFLGGVTPEKPGRVFGSNVMKPLWP